MSAVPIEAIANKLMTDLEEFVREVSPVNGVLAVRMEHSEGLSSGDTFGQLFGGQTDWDEVRDDLLAWAKGDQDALVCDWERAQLGLYRVGPYASLWVCCETRASEATVRNLWKQRRGPWQERIERRHSGGQPEVSGKAWRGRVSDTVGALLDETALIYETLRSEDPRADIEQAQAEFEALVEEWSNYCEPSVVSFPMLLDSLRQCMAINGKARALFFDQMQNLMARFLGG